ncbi:MAG: sigma-70 family RNA polymerase sigma factor [Schleiferiaceae bacterium]|nr:sigma-70 family RNA polymerase sigma factor [Schleiferiaceae bacterium]
MGKVYKLPAIEARLVKRCQRGDAAAQRELYRRYAGGMYTVCLRYCKRREEAEEVLSNGFVKVFRRLDQFHGHGSLGAWIKTIMVREALNFLRYHKNRFEEMDEERDYGHRQEEEALEAEHLLRLVRSLPTGYQTVFNLYALEGYGHQEIAAQLGISESTSKTQLRKARQQLQRLLENEGYTPKTVRYARENG